LAELCLAEEALADSAELSELDCVIAELVAEDELEFLSPLSV
jgi:hypothetical protein